MTMPRSQPSTTMAPPSSRYEACRSMERGYFPCQASSLLEHPLAPDDPHHHPGALLQAQVVLGGHVDDAVGHRQGLHPFERIAQRLAELRASGLGALQRLGHGALEQEARIP